MRCRGGRCVDDRAGLDRAAVCYRRRRDVDRRAGLDRAAVYYRGRRDVDRRAGDMGRAAGYVGRASQSVGGAARSDRRRAGDGALVVRLERADTPVRILEDLRVLGNVSLAGRHTVQTVIHFTSRLGVDIATPIAAEGVGEDEALVHEALLDVTITLEVGVRGSEFGCVG